MHVRLLMELELDAFDSRVFCPVWCSAYLHTTNHNEILGWQWVVIQKFKINTTDALHSQDKSPLTCVLFVTANKSILRIQNYLVPELVFTVFEVLSGKSKIHTIIHFPYGAQFLPQSEATGKKARKQSERVKLIVVFCT